MRRIGTEISVPAAWRNGSLRTRARMRSRRSGGRGDLTKQMNFISPDDGNADDKTVFEVKLPRPVAPGQDVQFKIKFKATFPEVIARTGYKRSFPPGVISPC